MVRRRRRAWLVMFATSLLLGVAFMVVNPMMANPDEPAHAIKAAAMARGELIGPETTVREHDPNIVNGTWSSVTVPKAFAQLGDIPACFAFHSDITAACSPPVSADTSPATATTYVGRYPPAYYLAVGWTSLVTTPWRALWMMRLVTVVICAALLASAAAALVERQGSVGAAATGETGDLGDLARGPWIGAAWLGLALALTPTVLWLAASINPNAVEIAGSVAAWVVFAAIADPRVPLTTRSLVRAAAVGSVLVASRPLAPAFLVAIVGLTWLAFGSRARWRELRQGRAVRAALGVLVVVTVLCGGWIAAVRTNESFMGYPSTASRSEVVRLTIQDLPDVGREMVGVFGWLDAPLPQPAILLWSALTLALVLVGLWKADARQRAAVGLLVVLLVVLPIVGNISTSQTVGYNWVGRYSLPLAVGLPLLAGLVLTSARVPVRLSRTFTVVAVPAVVVVQGVALATMLQRYVTGDTEPLLAFLGHAGGWQPVVTLRGAVALCALALVALVAALVMALRPPRHEDARSAAPPPAPEAAAGVSAGR